VGSIEQITGSLPQPRRQKCGRITWRGSIHRKGKVLIRGKSHENRKMNSLGR